MFFIAIFLIIGVWYFCFVNKIYFERIQFLNKMAFILTIFSKLFKRKILLKRKRIFILIVGVTYFSWGKKVSFKENSVFFLIFISIVWKRTFYFNLRGVKHFFLIEEHKFLRKEFSLSELYCFYNKFPKKEYFLLQIHW